MKRPPQLRAFTLVEVLIALAIFAGAAITLGIGYVNVLNGYELAHRATISEPDAQFARAQLLAQADVELARQGGDFTVPDGRTVRWTATIEPTELADLFTVTFDCEIAGGTAGATATATKSQTVRQTFRVLRPTWSVPAERNTLRAALRERIVKVQETVNK